MQIFRSVTQHLTQHANPSVPKGFLQIANLKIGSFYIMPILYWLAIAAVLYVVSKRTTFGRHVFAVGSNIRTARLSGINVNKVKRRIYMLTGMLVAIAAIIQVSRIGSMDYASAGSGYEMDAIAAVIVGGTSMSGGKGSIVGTVLGMLIIGVMNNLLTLFGVPLPAGGLQGRHRHRRRAAPEERKPTRKRKEPSSMFNIGIIGCGKIAQVRHIPSTPPTPRPGWPGTTTSTRSGPRPWRSSGAARPTPPGRRC